MNKINIAKEIIVPIFEKTNSINSTAKELGISWSTCKRILNSYGYYSSNNKNQYGEYDEYNLFSVITTEEDAYWLGVLYSDGWIRSDRNSIGLGSVDLDFIQKFQSYTHCKNSIQIKEAGYGVGKRFKDGHVIKSSKEFYTLEFSSKKTKENLIRLGCLPAKSKILECPTKEQVNDKLLPHFLRGYSDGDGWITWNSHYSYGFVGTQHFIEQIVKRMKIGHYGTIRKKINTEAYEFRIDKKELVKKVLDIIYNNASIYLDRKYKTYLLSNRA